MTTGGFTRDLAVPRRTHRPSGRFCMDLVVGSNMFVTSRASTSQGTAHRLHLPQRVFYQTMQAERTDVPGIVDGADSVARIRDLNVCVAIIDCLLVTQTTEQEHRLNVLHAGSHCDATPQLLRAMNSLRTRRSRSRFELNPQSDDLSACFPENYYAVAAGVARLARSMVHGACQP